MNDTLKENYGNIRHIRNPLVLGLNCAGLGWGHDYLSFIDIYEVAEVRGLEDG